MDRFSGMVRFKIGLRGKGIVNSVDYSCNHMQVFLKHRYNVNACISALHLMFNLNFST